MPIKFPISGDFGYSECSDEGLTLLMDATNSFDFSSQDLSSSCPSTSGSFSSTSSLYEPFTPTSRTSTPQHINYDGSFGDDSSMMDFTPPNSATSGYFPLDLKATVEPNMLINHGMPATPQRCNTIFDNSMSSHCSLDFTPGREMGLYPLDDGLYPSPCLDIQSSLPTQFDTNTPNFDFTSIWGQHGDSSPITFDSPSMHLMTPNSSPYDHNRRNVAMNGPQLSSTRLQQQTQPTIFDDDFMTDELAGQQDAAFHSSYMESLVQQTPSKSRPSKPRTATARPGARSQISGRVSKNGHDSKKGKMKCGTQKEKRPAFFCGLDQCEKRYMRAEHLKRHQEGKHALVDTQQIPNLQQIPNQQESQHAAEPFICTFCKVNKPFDPSRRDNFKDHIRRHQTDKPGTRTKYHPGAALLLKKLESENKGTKSGKPKKQKASEIAAKDEPAAGLRNAIKAEDVDYLLG